MPYLSVCGLEFFYRDEGKGSPIILGHSSTGSSGQWRGLSNRLACRYRLIAPDHIGCGRTAHYSGQLSLMEQEISITLRLVELAGAPVHLVGHSYGGSILARAALRLPGRVRSLALIEPTLFYLLRPAGKETEHIEIEAVADHVIHFATADNYEEAARGFIDYWVCPGAYATMDERLRTSIMGSIPALVMECPTSFEPSGATYDALARLDVPILLINGSNTTAAARGVVDILHKLWPDAPMIGIPNAGHMAPITHADQVNSVLEMFVDKHSGSGL